MKRQIQYRFVEFKPLLSTRRRSSWGGEGEFKVAMSIRFLYNTYLLL